VFVSTTFLQLKSLVFSENKSPGIIINLFKKLYICPLSHIVQSEIIEQHGTRPFFIGIWHLTIHSVK
jgi:hypothetical protein